MLDLLDVALAPPAVFGLPGGFFGARAVTRVGAGGLRKALPLVLLGVLAYTLARKVMGRRGMPGGTLPVTWR